MKKMVIKDKDKEVLTGVMNQKYIFPLPYNELDMFLNRNLSRFYF